MHEGALRRADTTLVAIALWKFGGEECTNVIFGLWGFREDFH